jgi:Leucine-rich repeat (LRR) protein
MADENNITSVEPDAFHTMTDLAFVLLSKNPLTDLDARFTHNEHLSYLDLSSCRLPAVPAGLPWATRHLQLAKNRITQITKDTFRPTR